MFVCLFVFFSYPTFVRLALSAFGLFFYTNGCKFSYARFPESDTCIYNIIIIIIIIMIIIIIIIIIIVVVISVLIVIRHIFYKSGSKTFCFRCAREGIVIVNFIPQNNK